MGIDSRASAGRTEGPHLLKGIQMANFLKKITHCFTGTHGKTKTNDMPPENSTTPNPRSTRRQSGGPLDGLQSRTPTPGSEAPPHDSRVHPVSSPSSEPGATSPGPISPDRERTGRMAKAATGIAKSAERALVKPVKHRVADALVPASKLVTAAVTGNSAPVNASPPHGAQLTFKHEGVYGVHAELPGINVTHNAMVIGNKILHAYDKATGKDKERNQPEYGGLRSRPEREFNVHGPRFGLKEGRVKVAATGLGNLNRKERKQQRARAKIVQAALNTMDGQRCTAVTPHQVSGGSLAEYAGGNRRWVGSRGEHVPFAAFDAIRSTHQEDLRPPPVGLLSGVHELPALAGEKQGTAWRLELGKLYVWDKSGERPSWKLQGEARSLAQHADGNLYAHVGDTLMRCNPLEPGKAALTPVPGLEDIRAYRSVHVMPPAEHSDAPKALAVDHEGAVFHLAADGQATLLAEIPGLRNLVPAPGGEALCGHTDSGKFIALSRMSVQSEHEAFSKLTEQIPLDVGHTWHVQSIGYEGRPGDAASPALHAILASDQGHRISMVYDQKKWIPQYKADATILHSDRGLKQEDIRPETRIQYDQDTHLAINTRGELCVRHQDIGRWDRIMTPDGQPLQNVRKIVTGANELTFGKRVYALLGEGTGTAIHEIDVGGRIKQLPAHSPANEIGGGAPAAWLSPNRLTAMPRGEITSVAQMEAEHTRAQRSKGIAGESSSAMSTALPAAPSPIVDLAANRGGHVYRLTEQGTIAKTVRAGAEGQISDTRDLPETRIGADSYHASQITVSGDNGRLFALARKTGEDGHAPLALLEFVPSPAQGEASGTAAAAPRRPIEGTWVNRGLEWKDAEGNEMPDALKDTARLSTSLLGTPMIEVTHPAESGGATDRYRILQVPVREPAEVDAPPRSRLKRLQRMSSQFFTRTRQHTPPTSHRFTLQDVRRSEEDPRVAMDNNDPLRPPVPGTKRTGLRWTVLGKQFPAINWAARKGESAGKKVARLVGGMGKSAAKSAYQLGRLVVQTPPSTAARLKQDIWGRSGLTRDYAAVREAMKKLADIQQPIAFRQAQISPARPEMLADPHANRVVETTLGHCLEAVEQMCITARVLEPDRQTERKPRMRRAMARAMAAPLNKATPNSRDALPKIKRFWDDIGADKLKFFTEPEQKAIATIKAGVDLLDKHRIKLWDGRRGALSNFTAYHGSHSIQTASLVTSMQHFSEAVHIRANPESRTNEPARPTALTPAATAALSEIEANQKAAIPNQLARCGFSGWHAYEAMVEAVTDLRAQINSRGTSLTPGSPLYELVKTDFDLQKAKSMPKDEFVALVANKWAEAVCSLQPRTVFGWTIEKGLGAGTYLGSGGNLAIETAAAKLSFGGIANIGGARRSFIGVEAIGSNHNQTEQGPVIVFMTRGMSGNASAGVGMGISPLVAKRPPGSTDTSPLHNEELGKHFGGFVSAMAEGTHTRAKGGALVLEPEKVHEFARMLFDDKVEPLALMRMGVNEGGIGLNLRENDALFRLGAVAVARQDWLKEAKEFGPNNPPEWGEGKRAQFNGMIGVRAALGVEIYHKTAMELHLRLGFTSGNGFEYQGDSGPRASAALAGYLFGGSAPANIKTGDDDAYVASARAGLLALDIGAAELSASWNSHYKRTADFVKPAGPVSNDDWKNLLSDAMKTPGLKLEIPHGVLPEGIGAHNLAEMDVTSTAGREAMRTLLDAWTAKLQDMETAVCHEELIEHIADPGERARRSALLNEAKGVDEHLACKFMVDAEAMSLKSHAAQYGLPMIQDSARIELNLPNTDPTQRDVNSNLRLGSVMKKAREVEAAIPGIKDIKAAYASLPGYNETRLVFEMDPRKINLANRLMILGIPRSDLSPEQRASLDAEGAHAAAAGRPPRHDDRIRLSGEQIMDILKSEPMNYHCVVHCAKNNEGNSIGYAWNVGLTMRHAVTATEERFLAETHIKHGWGARAVRAELLPTAQEALTDAARGRHPFTKGEVHTLRQTQARFEPPVRAPADVFVPIQSLELPEAEVIHNDNATPPPNHEMVLHQTPVPTDKHTSPEERVILQDAPPPVEPHDGVSGMVPTIDSGVRQTPPESEIVEEEIDPIELLAQVEAQKAARRAKSPPVEQQIEAKAQTFQPTQAPNSGTKVRFSDPLEVASPSNAQAPEAERSKRNRKFLGMSIPGTRKPSKTKAAKETPAPSAPAVEQKAEHKKKFGFGFGSKTKEPSGKTRTSKQAPAAPQPPVQEAFEPKSEQARQTSWGKLIAEDSGTNAASSSEAVSQPSPPPARGVDQGWGAMFNEMAKKPPVVPDSPRGDDQSWGAMFKQAAKQGPRDSLPATGKKTDRPE